MKKNAYIAPDMMEIDLVARNLMDVADLLIHSGENNQNPGNNGDDSGSFADEGLFDEEEEENDFATAWERLHKINLWSKNDK